MGRKKTICSANAVLQVDGKVHFTFRKNGVEVAVKELDSGHAKKLHRLLLGMASHIGQRFNLTSNNTHEAEKENMY